MTVYDKMTKGELIDELKKEERQFSSADEQWDSDGKPLRFSGSQSDVTGKKRIADVPRKYAKMYRALFEESKDTIIISDAALRIIDINKAGIELFGYTKEAILSLDPEKFYCDPEDRKRILQIVQNTGFVCDYEVKMKSKDGNKLIVHLHASAIRYNGQIYRYQEIIRDVTEIKRLERQLLQSQKMELVGILAEGVAHDLNNQLTAISGYGQLLMDNVAEEDEPSRQCIRNVLNAADRAAELTGGLLDFSRKQVISPKIMNIDNLISNSGRQIKRIIGEEIKLSTNFSESDLLVRADPVQIEQVLMNLANNARHSLPNGGRLSITTGRVIVRDGSETLYDLPSPGKYGLISIRYIGTGIDENRRESTFEPFYTAGTIGRGAGLGLSLARDVIKQHNGSVVAGNEPGKGSTFNIYIPLAQGHDAKEESITSAPPVGGMETLLLAEDEVIVRNFLEKILKRAGYKVIVADNGEDAVARFRVNSDISLVLSDLVMPKKNGIKMLDEIRKIKPDIKGVFLSGYAADIMCKPGMPEEGTEFITKPFDKEDLLQKVREILDKD